MGSFVLFTIKWLSKESKPRPRLSLEFDNYIMDISRTKYDAHLVLGPCS